MPGARSAWGRAAGVMAATAAPWWAADDAALESQWRADVAAREAFHAELAALRKRLTADDGALAAAPPASAAPVAALAR